MLAGFVHAGRLMRAGLVLAREGVFELIDTRELPPGPALIVRIGRLIGRRRGSEASLSAAFARLGPSWIKLGQFLATRRDVVGDEIAKDLSRLQDDLPPFPQALAEREIEAALGRPVDALFDSFGPPVAAASIAQVHRASAGGRDLAVKILRPDVEARFTRDLQTFFFAARTMERVDPASRRLRPVVTVETLARSVRLEMDLRMEAAAISEIASNTEGDEGFRVPTVDWERSAKRVLTLEWIDGIPIADRAALIARGFDLKRLARLVMQSFLRQALRDGFFHADMHQGNLFVDHAGTLVAVDFGIMGRLGARERRYLAEILWGFIRRDYRRTAEVHFEAGYVPAHYAVDDFAQALRAIGEPLRDKRASDISMGRLLTQLFDVTELFDMRTRPELLLLQKTMVVVEGVARDLDPELDMWATAEPVVGDWIGAHLGPAGRLEEAAAGLGALVRLAGQLPDLAKRAERLAAAFDSAAAHGLKLHPDTVRRIGAEVARHDRSGRIALWVIAAILLGLGVGLLSVL